MLGNKGNVNVRNITIVNLYDIWIYKVNAPKYCSDRHSARNRELELCWLTELTWSTKTQTKVFLLLVSREHKGTSDEVSWAAVWVPDVIEGMGSFLWVDAHSRGILYRHAPEKNNFPLQPVGLQVI